MREEGISGHSQCIWLLVTPNRIVLYCIDGKKSASKYIPSVPGLVPGHEREDLSHHRVGFLKRKRGISARPPAARRNAYVQKQRRSGI